LLLPAHLIRRDSAEAVIGINPALQKKFRARHHGIQPTLATILRQVIALGNRKIDGHQLSHSASMRRPRNASGTG